MSLPKSSPVPPAAEDASAAAAADLGRRVADARTLAGLTLATVAQRSGISVGFISQIESGTANPTLATLVKVADALGCDLGQLVAGIGKEHPMAGASFPPRFASLPGAAMSPDVSGIWDLSAIGTTRLAARLIRGNAGDHVRPVTHGGDEFAYVLAGSARVTVGGTSQELGPHGLCHFAATDVHQITEASSDLMLLVLFTEQ